MVYILKQVANNMYQL